MLKYKKMSLFDAEPGSILVHSCNAHGVWGSGIAAQFKEKFPRAFSQYNNYCKIMFGEDRYGTVGTCFTANEENYDIGCLITSLSYGKDKDNPDEILLQTILALNEFCKDNGDTFSTIYSNKFNSGLFNVPWKKTEKTLEYFVKRYNLNWVVCDPNL